MRSVRLKLPTMLSPATGSEGLIVGLNSSAIGTLVERTTRFTMLLHLPPMVGQGSGVRLNNGPTLAGHGAEAVRNAIAAKIATLPEQVACTGSGSVG